MDKQLPYRLQQKDDTKKHFFLSKKLKTLYRIIAERESVVLKEKKKKLVIENDEHILSMQNHKKLLRKIYTTNTEVKAHNDRLKSLSDLIENLTVEYEPIKQDLTECIRFIPFEIVYHRYEDLEHSVDEVTVKIESLVTPYLQFLEGYFNYDSISSINRIKRQLILTKNLPSHQKIIQSINKKLVDISSEQEELNIDLDEIITELNNDKTLDLKHRLDHRLAADAIVGNVFKFHHDSYELQKKIFAARYEIFRCIKEKSATKEMITRCETSGDIHPRLAKTLFDIQCFINDPITGSEFKDDYYGPLFNYLMSKDLIERDLWHELYPLMSVFIFGKVSTARAFHLALQKSSKNFEGYTLMGMDDFYTRPYQEIPHDLKEKVNPASEIVKINIRFQHILFRLLDGTIRVNDKNLNIEQLFRSKVAVVSEDNLSIGYWNSLISVGWTSDALGTRDSPLDHLHTLYRYVDKFIKEKDNLSKVETDLKDMKMQLQKLHCYKHRLGYVILHRTKDKFHLLMEKELKLQEDLIRNKQEMKCFENLKKELNSVDSWNLDELTTSCLNIDMSKIHQKNEMKCQIDENFGKLHDINSVISIHNDEMEHWMFNTLDHLNQWNTTTIADHTNYLVHCQELESDYFNMLLASMVQEIDSWNYKSFATFDGKEISSKIKLIENQGLLYKLQFDMKYLTSEIEANKKIYRDVEATDMSVYATYNEADLENILQIIDELQTELKNYPEPLSREQYIDLRETIQDVINFSNTPK